MRAASVTSATSPIETREATADELSKRVRTATGFVAFAAYAALCFGALWVARRLHMDPVNIETLTMVVWLPIGALAVWIKHRIDDYLLRPVTVGSAPG